MVPTEASRDADSSFDHDLASVRVALSSSQWDDAHKVLLRLVRTHGQYVEVVFLLALTRKMLGFDVSADALMAQALERGYAIPAEQLTAIEGKPQQFCWTEAKTGLQLRVRQRARRASLEFIGFDCAAPEPEAESPVSSAPDDYPVIDDEQPSADSQPHELPSDSKPEPG